MTTDERQAARGRPSAEEVRNELDAILRSSVFTPAGRSRELLRFVVEETLAGRGDRLKGYTVAVEVFGRAEDFDAQADPLVRVEAGRLRKRLAEYYRGVGQHAHVRIGLPRGGYTPTFDYGAAAPAARVSRPVASGQASVTGRRFSWPVAGVVAVMAIVVAALVVFYDAGAPSSAPPSVATARSARVTGESVAQPGPRMLVLPIADLSDASGLKGFAGGVTEEIVQALVSFNIVAIVNPAGTDIGSAALSALRAEFGVGYVLAGSLRVTNETARVAVRLIDAESGTLLWTSTFDDMLEDQDQVTAQRRVAAAIGAVLAEPRLAALWSSLAVLYLHEYIYGYTPQPDRGLPLDRALEAARTSLDIDGSGRVAAVSMAAIRLVQGDREAFQRAVARGLEMRPAHTAMLANMGYLLMIVGDADRGFAVLDEAMPSLFNVPSYVYVGYALGYVQRGQYDQALEAALKINSPDWVVAPLTKAAAAALAGRQDIAEREIQRLLELDPEFATEVTGLLERTQLNPTVRATVLEALKSAGLAIA